MDAEHPARLKVGIIGPGRVGAALGVALTRAGHEVVAVAAVSDTSVQRAREHFPEAPLAEPAAAPAKPAATPPITAAARELALASATIRATCSGGTGLAPGRRRMRACSPRPVMTSPPAAMIRAGTMVQGNGGRDP